ncbi:cytochrome c biogenesis protein DipZ [Rathayibacter sp. YIM 133350]|uniref:cytochrome c biogenesis protein DipZ n=1 Tax=Rathayibacter sp. YIM 133350 TaxID=3131992 RepID=UPI00307E9A78
MISLALIGFIGGLITGISPCILPVLPVIFLSGGAQNARTDADRAARQARWRPYLVIVGLVLSFSVFTLVGSLLLALLHLPQDFLLWAGVIVLVLIGIGLIVPRFEALLEKPFVWIPKKDVGTDRSGIGLGLALGAVYVPCAGPVLAAITVAGSTGRIGAETIVLTVSFAVGTALPLLVFALAGRRVAERVKTFRAHQRGIRITGGVVMIALAIGLAAGLPAVLQRLIPDYTAGFQRQLAGSSEVKKALGLGGIVTDANRQLSRCTDGHPTLQSCGQAPPLTGIQEWFNTPGDAPLALDRLRGHVVLVDFWAYSCINCQRSIPHVVAWDKAYRDAGLTVIGVHAPEYAFEKEVRNVKSGAADFGIDYPVAIDNSLSTWTGYRNRYWPAHYLIDAKGVVRHISFGEGGYDVTEKLLRELLQDANPAAALPRPTEVADSTPDTAAITRETFLGSTKQVNFAGKQSYTAGDRSFAAPKKLPADSFALDGDWALGTQNITPTGSTASVALAYDAREVRMVLGGEGTVKVTTPSGSRTIQVHGVPTSYRLLSTDDVGKGELSVEVSAGVDAYSFTFG